MSDQIQDDVSEDQDPGLLEQRVSLDEVFDRLYGKIHRLASRVNWRGMHPTLTPTALVHEAYLKLRKDSTQLNSGSYDEAIRIFANAMHQILVDATRRKSAQKRQVPEPPESADPPIEDALAVSFALAELERENPRYAQIVRCRFILGMTTGETAAATGQSKSTVERDWQQAKAHLAAQIRPRGDL